MRGVLLILLCMGHAALPALLCSCPRRTETGAETRGLHLHVDGQPCHGHDDAEAPAEVVELGLADWDLRAPAAAELPALDVFVCCFGVDDGRAPRADAPALLEVSPTPTSSTPLYLRHCALRC